MERVEVNSSNVKSIGYSVKDNVLEVEFTNGSVYQYPNVPFKLFIEIKNSTSVGSAFYSKIRKGGFVHRQIS